MEPCALEKQHAAVSGLGPVTEVSGWTGSCLQEWAAGAKRLLSPAGTKEHALLFHSHTLGPLPSPRPGFDPGPPAVTGSDLRQTGAEISPLASKQRMLLPASPWGRKDFQQHLLVLLPPSKDPPHPSTPTAPGMQCFNSSKCNSQFPSPLFFLRERKRTPTNAKRRTGLLGIAVHFLILRCLVSSGPS